MKKFKFITLMCLMLLIQACNNSSSSSEESSVEADGTYQDGTYCSNVEYYNPSTGTRNTYQLNVEVENNEVVKIVFPSGGWLDDDHFSPQELDRSGYCSFTSDKNNQYEINITGSECDFTDETKVRRDEEDAKEEEEKTCPKCGDVDPLMFSTDDQCSNCERKERRLQEEQEDEERRKREDEENQ